MRISKLIVGTAFYIPKYGATNKKVITLKKKNNLLRKCFKKKIKHFDVAPSYGAAEKNIGKLFFNRNIKIDNKISLLSLNKSKVVRDNLRSIFQTSLLNLRKKKIETLYIHSVEDFLQNKKDFINFLKEMKSEKKIKNIGFSIYSILDLKKILKYIVPDVIQFPFNLFNQEFDDKFIFKLKKKYNIKLYARSIFLQGMLLDQNLLKKKFYAKDKLLIKKYELFLKEKNLTSLEASLFLAFQKKFDKIIVGVEKLEHLNQILDIIKKKKNINIDFSKLKSNEKKITDIRKW